MRRFLILTPLLLLMWSGAPPVATGNTATPAADGDFSGLVDIGGRSLYLECRGTGSPTVILEAGFGNDAEIWDNIALPEGAASPAVWPGVSKFTRVCAYDRPGTFSENGSPSRSDPVTGVRTAGDIVADLHTLLTTAKVPGPYVLVGHSFGGLVVRLYASTYPDEVAGLVLVDAAQEDYYAQVLQALTPEQREAYSNAPEPEGYSGLEKVDTERSAAQMRESAAASPLQPMPLIVITHGQPWDWPEGYPADALEAIWEARQDKLVALVPDAQLVVAEESGHYVQLAQPELVIDAIHQVVDAVQNPGSWPMPAATPAS